MATRSPRNPLRGVPKGEKPIPSKGKRPAQHKMPNGMMMSDAEMKKKMKGRM